MRRDRDDDDDDDDDRPRRRRKSRDDRPIRRRRAARGQTWSPVPLLLVLFAISLVFGVVGGVVGIVWGLSEVRASAKQPPDGPPPTVRPPGDLPNTSPLTAWAVYRQPDGLYEARIPTSSPYKPPSYAELKPFGGDRMSQVMSGSTEIGCTIHARVLLAGSVVAERENLAEEARTKPTKAWLGRTAIEEVGPRPGGGGRVKRKFIDGDKLYEFNLEGYQRPPTDAELSMFFDHVVLNPR